jgi:hypothetical protein
MAIKNSQLTDTQLDILDVPAGKSWAITNVLVCNTSVDDAASFDMHLIPNDQGLSNDVTMVIRDLELPPSETFTFDTEKIVLEEGDRLSFVARPDTGTGETTLAATVSYLEV